MKWIFTARLFSLEIGGYRFSPGIVMTALTFALAYVMFSLGQWQLSRAQYKDNLQNKIVERQNKQAVSYNHLPVEAEERQFLPVILEGKYDSERSILLDNRVIDGVVGYDIFTPFIMNNGTAILVNRGFIPLGSSRQDIPQFSTPQGQLIVKGLLEKTPAKAAFQSDEFNQVKQWPGVVQFVDNAALELKLGYQLMDEIMRLDKNEAGGFKHYQPVINLDSAKNQGYAFQWFAMMAALLILYIVVNTKKRKLNYE